MRKKQFLNGFYRALGTGAALLIGALLLVLLALITGANVDIAGLKIS